MKISTIIICLIVIFSFTTLIADVVSVPGDASSIQGGIYAAKNGDTVLVAENTYYENINFRGKAITLASHYILDGDEAHIENTIIDGSKPANPDTGSVVRIVSGEDTSSVLSGFTIQGGTGSWVSWSGSNYRGGGGIQILNSGAIIEHNIIKNNSFTAKNAYGAGIEILGDYDTFYTIVRNNTFSENLIPSADNSGGGAAAIYTKAKVVFTYNLCINNSNSGYDHSWGGAVMVDGTNDLQGAITISNNIFKQNEAHGTNATGGAMFLQNANVEVYNNLFTENNCEVGGGAIGIHRNPNHTWPAMPPRIVNNTLVNNSAGYGGGISMTGPASGTLYSDALVVNTILWNNTASVADPDINLYRQAKITVNYSDVTGGYPGTGNINAEPDFKNEAKQLADSSPCIGAGTESYSLNETSYKVPERDLANNRRPIPVFSTPDIGAMENPRSYPDIYLEVPSEYESIQAAIDDANDSDVVLVEEGTYYENIDFKGKKITVASHYLLDGDTSYISKTVINGSKPRDPKKGSVVYFISDEDTNSVLTGFTITGGTGSEYTLAGFEEKDGGGIFIFESGAKISNNKIIDNHLFTDTRVSLGSGIAAMCDKGDFLIIENNEIRYNSIQADNGGGAVSIGTNDTIIFRNNLVESNDTKCSTLSSAGGLYVWGGDLGGWGLGIYNGEILVSDNIIKNNSVNAGTSSVLINGGGGVYIDMCSPLFENNLICNNSAEKYGGGVAVLYNTRGGISGKAEPVFINNTITNNTAKYGSGMCLYQAKSTLMNTIVWGNNSPDAFPSIYMLGTTKLLCMHSNFEGKSNGLKFTDYGGNIDENPIFRFPAHGEYSLDKYSPCIGTGVKSATIGEKEYRAPDKDLAGRERPAEDVDMGALESKFARDLDDLVLYLSFDDSTATDLSIYENKLGLAGEFGNVTGKNNSNAWYFDGASFIRVYDNDVLDTDTSMTISLWIRPDSVTSQGAKFMSKWYSSPQQGDWMFSLSSRDSLCDGLTCVQWAGYAANYREFGYVGVGIPRDSLHRYLVLNKWNHIAITYDRGYMCTYVNGYFVDDSMSQTLYTSLDEYDEYDDIYIGRFWRSWPGYEFIGSMDDIKIWDRALSPKEIYDDYDVYSTIDRNIITSGIPNEFYLYQNYPNPFNPVTAIGYQLPAVSNVNLSIFNILGEKVTTLIDERQASGTYQVEWNASGLAGGLYFYKITTEEFTQTKKLILLK